MEGIYSHPTSYCQDALNWKQWAKSRVCLGLLLISRKAGCTWNCDKISSAVCLLLTQQERFSAFYSSYRDPWVWGTKNATQVKFFQFWARYPKPWKPCFPDVLFYWRLAILLFSSIWCFILNDLSSQYQSCLPDRKCQMWLLTWLAILSSTWWPWSGNAITVGMAQPGCQQPENPTSVRNLFAPSLSPSLLLLLFFSLAYYNCTKTTLNKENMLPSNQNWQKQRWHVYIISYTSNFFKLFFLLNIPQLHCPSYEWSWNRCVAKKRLGWAFFPKICHRP